MKVVKKYTAIQLGVTKVNSEHIPTFSFGEETGPYYSVTTPDTEFDTEEDAIEYAYKTEKWNRWMIVPLISFNNFD